LHVGPRYRCDKPNQWYGWAPNNKEVSISTTLKGMGRAILEFGNCWKTGKVIF